ncbi:hypothetical protein CWB73_17140 [Pseudoalteromonas phenolica]|uniref:Uncharacterized protein n=1 Tax=Pseudoalteromonas phenolica TaxID=161398 RepID=A0A5S3YPG4_9GAMM|nr:hypothetical protein CWB73_17140 [Pseudoalteromonas phenolica]
MPATSQAILVVKSELNFMVIYNSRSIEEILGGSVGFLKFISIPHNMLRIHVLLPPLKVQQFSSEYR